MKENVKIRSHWATTEKEHVEHCTLQLRVILNAYFKKDKTDIKCHWDNWYKNEGAKDFNVPVRGSETFHKFDTAFPSPYFVQCFFIPEVYVSPPLH